MAKKTLTFETPFDTYVSTGVIGEGGSGVVYSAINTDGEQFAIKALSPDRITTDKLKRFKNEIGFCQKNYHKNILSIIDTGIIVIKDVKCPFYVMKNYSGTLRTLIGKLQPDNILKMFSQILDGVEAAHLVGVWHRDLKPENILYDKNNNLLIIADFGIAHFEEEEIYTAVETKVAARMANFLYASPEQKVRNQIVNKSSDIYALGLILNEMFTNEIIHGAGYKRISDINQDFAYLDDLVDSMRQQNPSNRPPSIEAIKKELIGRRNEFVAIQKYDNAKRKVIKESDLPDFEPITIESLDYEKGILHLTLNRNIPPGWSQEFQNPRGGSSSILGYGPENWAVSGNKLTIQAREDENIIQQIINYAKNYVNAANKGYVMQVQNNMRQEELRKKAVLEKEISEAKLRKNILSKVKL